MDRRRPDQPRLQSHLTVADVGWLRDAWTGPIVDKGIQSVVDARVVVEAGAMPSSSRTTSNASTLYEFVNARLK